MRMALEIVQTPTVGQYFTNLHPPVQTGDILTQTAGQTNRS
jgi:hypothetical protein